MTITPLNPLTRPADIALAPKPAATPGAAHGFAQELDAAAAAAQAPIPGKGPQREGLSDLQQFEGFVMRTFVEAMLPRENSSFFGSGTAGDIWRSMMAERIGEEIAAAGGVGIADLLEATGNGAGRAGDALRTAADAAWASELRKPAGR